MRIGELGEFGLIERISKGVPGYGPRVVVGIGDDAAVLRPKRGKLLVVTTDTMIEGVHFDLQFSSYFDIGWKAVSSNISDCAAMGGTPKEILITLGLPKRTRVHDVDDLYRGIKALAGKHDISLIGGDTILSPDRLVVSITLLGEVERKHLLLRSGAKVGDRILVTGTLGDSAAGLAALKHGDRDSLHGCPRLIKSHLMPRPLVKEGKAIARSGLANSMIDNSDGLARCVIELCRMSKVGAKIDLCALPVSSDVRAFSRSIKIDPIDLALNGGEDYGLVFTAPKTRSGKLIDEIKRRTGTEVAVVGEIINKKAGVEVVKLSGREEPMRSRGYEHLRRDGLYGRLRGIE